MNDAQNKRVKALKKWQK